MTPKNVLFMLAMLSMTCAGALAQAPDFEEKTEPPDNAIVRPEGRIILGGKEFIINGPAGRAWIQVQPQEGVGQVAGPPWMDMQAPDFEGGNPPLQPPMQILRGPVQLTAQQMEKATFLGVVVAPLPREADAPNEPRIGLRVQQVTGGGPAAAAGVKTGDILTQLDDQLIINPDQFVRLVRMHKAGDKIKLKLTRGPDEAVELTATLIEKEVPVRVPPEQRAAELLQLAPGAVAGPFVPGGTRRFTTFIGDLQVKVTGKPDGKREFVVLRKKPDQDGWEQPEEAFRGPMPDKKALAALPEDVQRALAQADNMTFWWDWEQQTIDDAQKTVPRFPDMPLFMEWQQIMPNDVAPIPLLDHMFGTNKGKVTIKTADGTTVTRERRAVVVEHLTVKNVDGEIVYEGPAPDDKQMADLPENVRKALRTAQTLKAEVRTDGGAPGDIEIEIRNHDHDPPERAE